MFQTNIRELSMMQTNWSGQLNPILNNPSTNPIILKGIPLINGTTVVNTSLTTTLQGWVVADITAAATIYRSAPKAPLTLTLHSSAATIVDLMVW